MASMRAPSAARGLSAMRVKVALLRPHALHSASYLPRFVGVAAADVAFPPPHATGSCSAPAWSRHSRTGDPPPAPDATSTSVCHPGSRSVHAMGVGPPHSTHRNNSSYFLRRLQDRADRHAPYPRPQSVATVLTLWNNPSSHRRSNKCVCSDRHQRQLVCALARQRAECEDGGCSRASGLAGRLVSVENIGNLVDCCEARIPIEQELAKCPDACVAAEQRVQDERRCVSHVRVQNRGFIRGPDPERHRSLHGPASEVCVQDEGRRAAFYIELQGP